MDLNQFKVLISTLRYTYLEYLDIYANDPDSINADMVDGIEMIAIRLSHAYKEDYPGFNRKKFLGAILGDSHPSTINADNLDTYRKQFVEALAERTAL